MLGVCQYSIAIRATYNFVRKIDNHTSMCYLLDVKTLFSEKQIMMPAFIALINPKKWQTVDSYHLKNGAKSRTCVWSTSNNLRLFLATLPCIKWSFIHQKFKLFWSFLENLRKKQNKIKPKLKHKLWIFKRARFCTHIKTTLYCARTLSYKHFKANLCFY